MPLLESLFSQSTIERLGWMLVYFLWQATAVALLLAGLLRLLHRVGANLRYAVACGALALMAVLPLITMQLVEVPGPVAEAGPPPVVSLPATATPVIVDTIEELPPMAPAPPMDSTDLSAPIPWKQRIVMTLEPALPYLVLGWLAGVFGLSTWHLGGWAQLQRWKRRMTRRAGDALLATLDELTERLGLRQTVALLESGIVEVPTVIGWLRPAILLPASALTGLSPDQLRAILAHELAHIRRYDYFANILQTVVEILGFYHPAVWWVSNRIRIERENCCDDLAVSICGSSLQYARALTSMEEMRHSRTDLAMAASGGSLMARIARVLGRPAVDDRRFAWLPGLIALLLVAGILIPAALVFAAPGASPALPPVAESNGVALDAADANAPNDSGQAVAMAQPVDSTESQDKAYILVDFAIARALFDAPLDQETMLLIANILAAERPQIVGADPKSKLTLGEVLKAYVTRESLSQETGQALLELLQTRGFVNILSRPNVTTTDGNQAQVRIGYEQPIVPPSQGSDPVDANAIERIECGTSIYMTTHVEQNKYVTLDMTVRMADPVPQEQSSDLPIIRTMEIASTVTVPDNRCFWLLVEPGGDPNAPDRDPESTLVVFRPSIVRSASVPADEAAAQTPQSDERPRQVLLDARVVAIEGGGLPNVGVEWAHPTMQLGQLDNAADWFSRITIGYSPDRVFTEALMARLSQLEASNHARLISNPQVVAQDGHPARLRSVQEEWFLISDPGTDSPAELQSIESATALSVTPRIDEKDQITLDIEFELSNTLPRQPDDNLPIVTRRMAKNAVTIKDGGTVAIAGLGKSPFGQSSQSTGEIAIFVTAHLIPTDGRVVISRPAPASEARRIADDTSALPSQAWTIMRYPGCSPLLLGLTQQFAKVLAPSRRSDPAWKDNRDGGMLRLKIDVEGEDAGEILVGLFGDATWLQAPVAVRRVSGAGAHVLAGLPAGRYQIGAMIGEPPVARMLGVQRQWPQAVEIGPGRTATAEVLLSEEFQRCASGWFNENVANDYLGDWGGLDQSHLLQGQLLGPDGEPIRFAEVQIREYKDPAQRQGGIAAPNIGTNEQGYYRFDGMNWPYRVSAMWRDPIPSAFGYRSQFMRLNRVMEGPQRADFRFKPFPTGTAKVTGRVTDEAGQPVTRFFLRVTTPPMPTTRSETMDGGYETYIMYQTPFISEDGRFELAGLPNGPAQVHPIPLDNQSYERQWGRETTLAANDTTVADFELTRAKVRHLYGRVLFEDGAPAVLHPVPWPGATTLLQTTRRTFPVRGGVSAKLDSDGYFTLELRDRDYEPLAQGEHQLSIGLPEEDERGWRPSGGFPFDKLADDKSKAGVVTVKRPLPTRRFPGELGEGGPLPSGWRLTHDPGKERMQQVLLNAEVVASNSSSGHPPGNEEFVIYDPDSKEVETFTLQSMMVMPKAQQYRLIGRQIEGGHVLHGPYALDMTQMGFYKLTVDVGLPPEPNPDDTQPDASADQTGASRGGISSL